MTAHAYAIEVLRERLADSEAEAASAKEIEASHRSFARHAEGWHREREIERARDALRTRADALIAAAELRAAIAVLEAGEGER